MLLRSRRDARHATVLPSIAGRGERSPPVSTSDLRGAPGVPRRPPCLGASGMVVNQQSVAAARRNGQCLRQDEIAVGEACIQRTGAQPVSAVIRELASPIAGQPRHVVIRS